MGAGLANHKAAKYYGVSTSDVAHYVGMYANARMKEREIKRRAAGYEYPFIRDRDMYAAVVFVERQIEDGISEEDAIVTAVNRYEVSQKSLTRHIGKRKRLREDD